MRYRRITNYERMKLLITKKIRLRTICIIKNNCRNIDHQINIIRLDFFLLKNFHQAKYRF